MTDLTQEPGGSVKPTGITIFTNSLPGTVYITFSIFSI
ncbi:hypothetical protein NNO_1665 [Hydrogenimonas sp.]|nr:hypothetical protein NNO_1665 [Hydrogenimonas sp.]